MTWLMEILNKDLTRRTASDKVLRDKAFNIAKNPKYDGYQRGRASLVYNFSYRYTCKVGDLIYMK